MRIGIATCVEPCATLHVRRGVYAFISCI